MIEISQPLAEISGEVLLILMVGWMTREKFTFAGSIATGSFLLMGAAEMLLEQHFLGFPVLIYGITVMIIGMKEEQIDDMTGEIEILGKALGYVGHYLTAAIVLELAALYSFWPTI